MALPWMVVVGIVTACWGAVALIGPWFVRSGTINAEVYRCGIVMTAACCWLHWLLCFLHQVNPLSGPLLSKESVDIIRWSWEDK